MRPLAERLVVASLSGLAARFAGGFGEGAALHPQVVAELDGDIGPAVRHVLGELHAITGDWDLLTEAATITVIDDDPDSYGPRACRLLELAGADLDEARRRRLARGNGWVTPQAEPGL